MSDSGKATITRAEIAERRLVLSSEQLVMSILQEKGAPIHGIIYFVVDPAYDWTMYADPNTGDFVYTWNRCKLN